MDMRHPEYRELARTRNARALRKLRHGMRRAERRSGVKLTPREALQRHHTFRLVDSLFAKGEQGAFYQPGPGSVFQDADGKIPARDGDPVRLITGVGPEAVGHIENRWGEPPVYRDGPLPSLVAPS